MERYFNDYGCCIICTCHFDCFFRYKIQKIISVLQTLCVMLIISAFVVVGGIIDRGNGFGIILLIMLIFTITMCYLVCRFFWLDIFISVFLTVMLFGWIIGQMSKDSFVLSIILALPVSIFAAIFHKVAIIILTSIRGTLLCSLDITIIYFIYVHLQYIVL